MHGEGDDGGFSAMGIADPLASETEQKKSRSGALVLILVIGLAIGSLFSMHTLTKVTASSGQNKDVENTIDTFLDSLGAPGGGGGNELANQHEEVIQILTESYPTGESDLDRNPFDVGTPGSGQSESDPTMLGQGDYERALENVNVKSVIMGSRPLANVNGKIVRIGKTVTVSTNAGMEVQFQIVSISRDSVRLKALGADFEGVAYLKQRR